MMTIPCLALFYSGMVRQKNVLAMMAQSFGATALVSLLWFGLACSLSFRGDGALIGGFDRAFLTGMGVNSVSHFATTIPEALFMAYQMTFAVITCALVADRLKFSAFMLFCTLGLFVVYAPTAHWIWGGGFLGRLGVVDFAGGTVVHINAGVAGLVAALTMGVRKGYGRENLAPYDLTLAVIGTGLLWVGWFGFNAGSALTACSRAVRDRRDAPVGLRRGAGLERPRVVGARQAVCAWPHVRRRGRARNDHAGVGLRPAVAGCGHRRDRRRRPLLGEHRPQAQTEIRRFASTCSASTVSAALWACC